MMYVIDREMKLLICKENESVRSIKWVKPILGSSSKYFYDYGKRENHQDFIIREESKFGDKYCRYDFTLDDSGELMFLDGNYRCDDDLIKGLDESGLGFEDEEKPRNKIPAKIGRFIEIE